MRACDLFCCAGGFTTGLVGAFEVVLGIDNDEAALRVYRANHTQSTAVNLDLRDVGGAVARIRAAGHIDLIAASPPCTDFSSAGSRGSSNLVLHSHIFQILWESVPRRLLTVITVVLSCCIAQALSL